MTQPEIELGEEVPPPWLRDPLPGEPGHPDTPFPPPPLPFGYVSPGYDGANPTGGATQ